MNGELLTIAEAAARLRVHPETVRRLYPCGDLSGFQVMGKRRAAIRLHAESVERYRSGGAGPQYIHTGKRGRPAISIGESR